MISVNFRPSNACVFFYVYLCVFYFPTDPVLLAMYLFVFITMYGICLKEEERL